jgi:hypothetical protein
MKQWRGLLSLVKHAELMNLRETEIGRIIRYLSKRGIPNDSKEIAKKMFAYL